MLGFDTGGLRIIYKLRIVTKHNISTLLNKNKFNDIPNIVKGVQMITH